MEKIKNKIVGIYNKLDEKYDVKKYIPAILYLVFGVTTTIINIVTYILLTKCFNVDYLVSNIVAWVLAVTVAYITNKLYVFESDTKNKKELLNEIFKFFVVRVFSLLVDTLIMYIGHSVFGINDVVMKFLSNVVVIVTNYFMSRYIVFSKENKEKKYDTKNILSINVSFFVLIFITLLVVISDIIIFLTNIEYKISIIFSLCICLSIFYVLYRKRKIKIVINFCKFDILFWLLGIIFIAASIVYPDSFWDTRSYHIYLQENPFADKINSDFFAGRTLNSFLFALPDRIHYIFRYFLGYRLGTIMSYYLIFVLYYQVKKFLKKIIPTCKEGIISLISILPTTLFVVIEQTGTYYIDNFSLIFCLELFYMIFFEIGLLKNRLKTLFTALLVGLVVSIKVSNAVLLVPLFIYFLIKNYKDFKYLKIYDYLLVCLFIVFPFMSYMIDNIIQTGSPVFPYYNNILKSEYFMEESWKDTRFGGKTLFEILFWPLYGIKYPNRLYDYGNIDIMWYAGYAILIFYTVFKSIKCIYVKVEEKINNKINTNNNKLQHISKVNDKSIYELSIVILFTYLMWSKLLVGYIRYASILVVITYIIVIALMVKFYSNKKYILGLFFTVIVLLNVSFTVNQYKMYKQSLICTLLNGNTDTTSYISNAKLLFNDKSEEKIEIDGVWGVIFDDSYTPTLLRKDDTPIYNLRKSMTSTNELTDNMYQEKVENSKIYVPLPLGHMLAKLEELGDYGFRVTGNITTYFDIKHLDVGETLYLAEVEYVGSKVLNELIEINSNNSYIKEITDTSKSLNFAIAIHPSLKNNIDNEYYLEIVLKNDKSEVLIDTIAVDSLDFKEIEINLENYNIKDYDEIVIRPKLDCENANISRILLLNSVL